jgi:ATP-dependent RNA helicase HelY
MDVTFAWASGDELIDILNEDLTAGDFVRTMKQLIDLLRQISLVAQLQETRDSALACSQALLRGVVAASQGSVLQ